MKTTTTKFIILSLFFIVVSVKINAQTIKIDTTEITFEDKLRPCLATEVDPLPNELLPAWIKFIKKNYSIDLKNKGVFSSDNLLSAIDVTSISITNKRFNLYTRITEIPSGSFMNVFASFGYDIFIGPKNYPKEFKSLATILFNFLNEELNTFYTKKSSEIIQEISALNKSKIAEIKLIDKNKIKISDLDGSIAKLESLNKSNGQRDSKMEEKLNNEKAKKTHLENENRQSELLVQNMETKIASLQESLQRIKMKHEGLKK